MKAKLEKKLYGLIHGLEEIQVGSTRTSTSADSTSSTI